MKKLLRYALVCAMVMIGSAAMADTTTVGSEDNSTEWWSAFSDYYTIAPNKTLHLKFVNYTSKGGNWNNWIVALTTEAERGGDGYSEYVVLRADNWGWNASADTQDNSWYVSLTSNYNWDIFKDEMDGSTVDMTIKRVDARVTIHADITALSGNTYFEEFIIDCGDGTQNINAFLTTEGGHLVIDNAETTVTDSEAPVTITIEGTQIGETDLTTGWWSAFSEYFTLKKNQILTVDFKNYTNGQATWNNWSLALTTDADRGADGYSEYYVLRADNYGWGDKYNAEGLTSNYNWDTFAQDMNGSHVKMTVTRDGDKVTAHAAITTTDEKEYFEELVTEGIGDGEQNIRAFLTVDHGCLDLLSYSITDNTSNGIGSVKAEKNDGIRYNLAGQRVDAAYKGMVIENGKKMIVK